MTGVRKRSTIHLRIVQGRGVRWQGAGVVSRRVPIDTGAQHTEGDNEEDEKVLEYQRMKDYVTDRLDANETPLCASIEETRAMSF